MSGAVTAVAVGSAVGLGAGALQGLSALAAGALGVGAGLATMQGQQARAQTKAQQSAQQKPNGQGPTASRASAAGDESCEPEGTRRAACVVGYRWCCACGSVRHHVDRPAEASINWRSPWVSPRCWGNNVAERTERKLLLSRWGQLKAERESWMSHWKEISDYLLPRSGRFFINDRNRGEKRHNNILDNTGTRGAARARCGMMAGMNSPARPWFRLTTWIPKWMESAAVKAWLAECHAL